MTEEIKRLARYESSGLEVSVVRRSDCIAIWCKDMDVVDLEDKAEELKKLDEHNSRQLRALRAEMAQLRAEFCGLEWKYQQEHQAFTAYCRQMRSIRED
jgi:hypothetical protein